MPRYGDEDQWDETVYKVVVNDEAQYSIWPGDRETPRGWNDAGFSGPKEACLDYIRSKWEDSRPPRLR